MPTVLELDDLRVAIYANDESPPRVHVIGADREAIFDLNCPDGPPLIRESLGFSPSELSRVASALTQSLSVVCNAWSKIHGNL